MAIFYPNIEKINQFKVPPTEGERTLLDFLGRVLDDTYEVYFNPYLNGDRPDVLIMRQGNGVMVIEVKDWNLNNFELNEKKKWVYTPNGSVVKSPIDQVQRYKSNLFDLHVDMLLDMKIKDVRHFGIVTCALYFHCATQSQVEELIVNPYKKDIRYQDFLRYNIDLIGRDGLKENRFNEILHKRYLSKDKKSYFFTEELYGNFKRLLSPPIHMKAQGIPYIYTTKQKEIIFSSTLEQRVKGVFGSGKTTVLAARAVQAYKRALKRNTYPRILILTYNITLKNFIHDKLMKVDEIFPIESFIIINYHKFITAELNNLNIEFHIPEGLLEDDLEDYLEQNYYSNKDLFEEHKSEIVKYDAVFIDEIQDYKRVWMDIIKNYFRDPLGDYVLFGDVMQNVYGLPTERKDVITNVVGRPSELNKCFRADSKILDLVKLFQKNIFGEKYNHDVFDEQEYGTYQFFDQQEEKEGYINYMYLSDTNTIASLYNIIRGNIQNKINTIAPNDITILGNTVNQLRLFDCYYRNASKEITNSMFESIETMYMQHLNFYGKNMADADGWFKEILGYISKKLFPKREVLYDSDMIKLRQHVAKLFAIYDLYSKYSSTFTNRLKEFCGVCGISPDVFFDFVKNNKDELEFFKLKVYNSNYKDYRNNKKLHFWMNRGPVKISTINSFKGWESEVVFLIIEPKYDNTTSYNMSFDELLYTGITRCKRHLIIVNFGNEDYDKKIRPLIEKIK